MGSRSAPTAGPQAGTSARAEPLYRARCWLQAAGRFRTACGGKQHCAKVFWRWLQIEEWSWPPQGQQQLWPEPGPHATANVEHTRACASLQQAARSNAHVSCHSCQQHHAFNIHLADTLGLPLFPCICVSLQVKGHQLGCCSAQLHQVDALLDRPAGHSCDSHCCRSEHARALPCVRKPCLSLQATELATAELGSPLPADALLEGSALQWCRYRAR